MSKLKLRDNNILAEHTYSLIIQLESKVPLAQVLRVHPSTPFNQKEHFCLDFKKKKRGYWETQILMSNSISLKYLPMPIASSMSRLSVFEELSLSWQT